MEDQEKRIHELETEIKNLKEVRKTLRHNFQGMVQLLVETISLSNRFLGGHLKRTSEMIKSFLEKQNLPKDSVFFAYYAALLHDIGLVGEDAVIIEKPREELSEEEEKLFLQHPVRGYEIVNAIYNLKRIAASIRAHHENYDGTGFPDKLIGREIPEVSRLLHIVDDFDHLRFKYNTTPQEAAARLLEGAGTLYDPEMINQFESFINLYYHDTSHTSKAVDLDKLEAGMYLDEDIILSNGVLLAPKGIILDDLAIDKIHSFSSMLRSGHVFRVIY